MESGAAGWGERKNTGVVKKGERMANHFERDCEYCGKPIRMAEMSNGKWLPFELDGSGRHRCISYRDSNTTFTAPQHNYIPQYSPIPESYSGNGFRGVKYVVLIIILLSLWYFFK